MDALMRSAECGMRNAELQWRVDGRATLVLPFRIPHSAFGHTADARLSRNEDGEVTHAVTHTPHPTHPSGRITGRPPLSSASAFSPTGQARAHTPHDTPWNVIQRSGSSSSTPMCTSSQPAGGGTSAPVSHARAQGISAHTTHAWIPGSMMGVPAARPAAGGALMIACTGHTVTQSPQRVHDARKLISSDAPGGRK